MLAGFAVGMTLIALLLAVYGLGPAVREIFGAPQGFREDFISPAAFHQALLVQAIAVGLVFFVLGIASGRLIKAAPYSDAVWMANPLTVGFGFVAYKSVYHALHSPSYLPEYDSPQVLGIFFFAAPIVFAGCFYLGAKTRNRSAAVDE